jgi:hypothetical protein
MHKFSRTLLLAGVMAFGTLSAACGDKVTVAGPGGAAGVQLVTVTPPSATIAVGEAIILSGQVTADAASAKTVTWSTSNAAVATVDQTGKVTGVKAGSASITATSTADVSKAASSIITVSTAGGSGTPAISISTVNQGGTGVPAILTAVANQLDVVMNVTGGAGTVELFLAPLANCTSNTIAATDQLVASQSTVSSQSGPVTLSFNTAQLLTATGQPRFLNGQYCIKSRLTTSNGTAIATNTIPLTLANLSTYTSVLTYATVTGGATQAISGLNGLSYNQGTLTAVVTPINFVTASPLASLTATLTRAGTPAQAAVVQTATAAANGTFTFTYPASGSSATIAQYTSPTTGDVLSITSSVNVAGQNSFTGIAAPLVRIDNQSPLAPTNNTLNNVNGFINGAYAFAGTGGTAPANGTFYQSGNDLGVDGNTIVFGYRANDASFTPLTGGTSTSVTTCAQTGWTIVAKGSDIPNSTAGAYVARIFETDKLGNVRCSDLGGAVAATFGVDLQAPFLTVAAAPADQGPALIADVYTATYVDSALGGILGSGFGLTPVLVTTRRNSIITGAPNNAANCTYGTFSSSTCNPATRPDGTVPVVGTSGNFGQAGYYTTTITAVDQANNQSVTVTRTVVVESTGPTFSGGVSIPTLASAGTAIFSASATDSVDIVATAGGLRYPTAAGTFTFGQNGPSCGTAFDAVLTTSCAIQVNFAPFYRSLTDAANFSVLGVKPDQVTIVATNAAGLSSTPLTGAIAPANVQNGAALVAGVTFANSVNNATLSNGDLSAANPQSTTISAVLTGTTTNLATTPFSQVVFYVLDTRAGSATNGMWIQIGSTNSGAVSGTAPARTITYSTTWNPAASFGFAGTVDVVAVGSNAAGDAVVGVPVTITLTQ